VLAFRNLPQPVVIPAVKITTTPAAFFSGVAVRDAQLRRDCDYRIHRRPCVCAEVRKKIQSRGGVRLTGGAARGSETALLARPKRAAASAENGAWCGKGPRFRSWVATGTDVNAGLA